MKRALPLAFVLPLSLLLEACTAHPGPAVSHQAPQVFGNVASYDAYVERRANDLVRAGVKSNAATQQAQTEAERRYGPRASAESASIGRTWGSKSRTLTMAELDSALAKGR